MNGKLVGLPINLEGPLFYWNKEIFKKCNVAEPMFLEEIPEAAAKLKGCAARGDATVWAARGIRGAISYAVSAFIYNSGGDFATPDGKPGLCLPGSVKARHEGEAELFVLTAKEGGRHTPFGTGYMPQFYFGATNVTGTLVVGDEGVVKPGDRAKVTFRDRKSVV